MFEDIFFVSLLLLHSGCCLVDFVNENMNMIAFPKRSDYLHKY